MKKKHVIANQKGKYRTALVIATKRTPHLKNGEQLKRPPHKSTGFKWRDPLAREMGWRIWDVLHPLILETGNPKQIRRVLTRQVQGLLNGPFVEDIITSVACMGDPMKMLLKLLKGLGRRDRTTVDSLMVRSVVRDFLHRDGCRLSDFRALEDICLEILGIIPPESGTPVASWPSFLSARLKSKRYVPVKGHIKPTATKESVLAFFETNPYLTPPVQKVLGRWLRAGSRCQTFRKGYGRVSAPDQILVGLYPEEHVFWMSCNFVALRNDVQQLRQQFASIDLMLRLRVFLKFNYDPELRFAPNDPHNLLGFLCSAEERANAAESDTLVEKLRRALGRFDEQLYCEEEAISFPETADAEGDEDSPPARRPPSPAMENELEITQTD